MLTIDCKDSAVDHLDHSIQMSTIDLRDLTVDHLNHSAQMSTVDHQDGKSMSTIEKVQENDLTTITIAQ